MTTLVDICKVPVCRMIYFKNLKLWSIRCFDDKAGYRSNVNGMTKSFLNSRMMATVWHDKKRRASINCPTPIVAASASPLFSGQVKKDTFGSNFYQDVCLSLSLAA